MTELVVAYYPEVPYIVVTLRGEPINEAYGEDAIRLYKRLWGAPE